MTHSSYTHSLCPLAKVELQLNCKNLVVGSNTYVHVKYKNVNGIWLNLGNTEIIKNGVNPKFIKVVEMNYFFNEIQELEFKIMNVEYSLLNGQQRTTENLIGVVYSTLVSIITSPNKTVAYKILDHNRLDTQATLYVTAKESCNLRKNVVFRIMGTKLAKHERFSKLNPCIKISKTQELSSNSGAYILIHKTEYIKHTSNPIWRQFEIPLNRLCHGDMTQNILFQCYHSDSKDKNKEKFIGQFTSSLTDIIKSVSTGGSFKLINATKLKDKKYESSGNIKFLECSFTNEPSFMDYIAAGYNINTMIAVDFNSSNGDVNDPNSLHYFNNEQLNEYERVMINLGSVLSQYSPDKAIASFGFGGQISLLDEVSRPFPLNGNIKNPEVYGVGSLIDIYHKTLNTMKLGKPSNFSDIVKLATSYSESKLNEYNDKSYNVLVVITNNIVNDIEETIKTIVDLSEKSALSIIIVGVGKNSFKKMELFDSSINPLYYNGKAPVRDLVTYVQFKKFKGYSNTAFITEALDSIIDQYMSWMIYKNVIPDDYNVSKSYIHASSSYVSLKDKSHSFSDIPKLSDISTTSMTTVPAVSAETASTPRTPRTPPLSLTAIREQKQQDIQTQLNEHTMHVTPVLPVLPVLPSHMPRSYSMSSTDTKTLHASSGSTDLFTTMGKTIVEAPKSCPPLGIPDLKLLPPPLVTPNSYKQQSILLDLSSLPPPLSKRSITVDGVTRPKANTVSFT